jgi:fructose-specific component phosphotransferase system IIB-like protein
MPRYRIGDQTVRRKNFYRPCVLTEEFANADNDELVRLLKATSWCDNITNAEWKVVLGEEDASAPNRSRLRKKAAGWLIALARIAVLNPELFEAAAKDARKMYAEQVKQDYPWNSCGTLPGCTTWATPPMSSCGCGPCATRRRRADG